MRILCVFGRHNYGDASRGEGYEYSNFLPALRALGHDVHHFESWDRERFADFAALNVELLAAVERLRPDVVFCVLMAYEVWLETLTAIRRCGAAVLNWGTDDSWRYEQFAQFVAPHVDLWATTSTAAAAKSAAHGLSNFFPTQWAASSARTHQPLPAQQCRYQVTFVGSAYGNRTRWVEGLAARGIEVSCFGHGWPNGPVAAERIPEIYRESLVSLNFGDSGLQWRGARPYRSRQIKARVFEVPAAGGCLLTEPAEELEQYYRIGAEIDIFRNEEELARHIRSLLADPARRDAMAQAGYRRTLAAHLYEARFPPLLQSCVDNAAARPSAAAEPFDEVVRRHRRKSWLRTVRAAAVLPFRLLYGSQRGLRAARRAAFEISWRACGAVTYTARGLPGRLFYRES